MAFNCLNNFLSHLNWFISLFQAVVSVLVSTVHRICQKSIWRENNFRETTISKVWEGLPFRIEFGSIFIHERNGNLDSQQLGPEKDKIDDTRIAGILLQFRTPPHEDMIPNQTWTMKLIKTAAVRKHLWCFYWLWHSCWHSKTPVIALCTRALLTISTQFCRHPKGIIFIPMISLTNIASESGMNVGAGSATPHPVSNSTVRYKFDLNSGKCNAFL